MKRTNTRQMVLLALFTAILILLGFTPLGLIDLPLIKATILHVPVIVGAILLGPKCGLFLGAVFGVISLAKNTMAPSLLSFAFSPVIPVPGTGGGSPWALLICFIPRMLVGVTPWLVWKLFCRLFREKRGQPAGLALAAAVGAFTNTTLVMGLIYLVFREAYAAINGIPETAVLTAILSVVGTNGVPEAIAAAVITPAVVLPLQRILGKTKPNTERDRA